jgi:hypothetical protein
MKWVVTASAGWLSRDGKVRLAKAVAQARRRFGQGSLREAHALIMKGEQLEFGRRDVVTAVCQCLQDEGVNYQIYKVERVDIDFFKAESRQLAPA